MENKISEGVQNQLDLNTENDFVGGYPEFLSKFAQCGINWIRGSINPHYY